MARKGIRLTETEEMQLNAVAKLASSNLDIPLEPVASSPRALDDALNETEEASRTPLSGGAGALFSDAPNMTFTSDTSYGTDTTNPTTYNTSGNIGGDSRVDIGNSEGRWDAEIKAASNNDYAKLYRTGNQGGMSNQALTNACNSVSTFHKDTLRGFEGAMKQFNRIHVYIREKYVPKNMRGRNMDDCLTTTKTAYEQYIHTRLLDQQEQAFLKTKQLGPDAIVNDKETWIAQQMCKTLGGEGVWLQGAEYARQKEQLKHVMLKREIGAGSRIEKDKAKVESFVAAELAKASTVLKNWEGTGLETDALSALGSAPVAATTQEVMQLRKENKQIREEIRKLRAAQPKAQPERGKKKPKPGKGKAKGRANTRAATNTTNNTQGKITKGKGKKKMGGKGGKENKKERQGQGKGPGNAMAPKGARG